MDAFTKAIQGRKRGINMWLCKYDLSKECKGEYKDCTDCILDKIRAEIEKQEKWLLQAGYNAYNVDIAFSSIKSVLAESEDK